MASASRLLLAGLAFGHGLVGAAALRTESSEGVGSLLSYKAAVLRAARSSDPFGKTLNCSRDPILCEAPLNCQEKSGLASVAPAKDGHPNFNMWCLSYPLYTHAGAQCARGNLSGYIALVKKDQEAVSKMLMVNVSNVDAEYCFLAGHCDSPHNPTDGSSVEEMEKMCDAKYGAEHWRHEFAKHYPGSMLTSLAQGVATGKVYVDLFHPGKVMVNQAFADTMAELACGMGNYHCDVAYCKQTFCTHPYWSSLHSHLGVEAARNNERKAQKAAKAGGTTRL
uniref:Uncharacterized protein n=1 Tax=Alexandrium catenella TaxID=2925 RepID=A0A7S1PIM4_ALECA